MNVFYLDENPELAVRFYVDRHILKMQIESCQMLCSAFWLQNLEAPYKLVHKNHPCSKWCRHSLKNFNLLLKLAQNICYEYTFRYGKIHACSKILEWVDSNKRLLKFDSEELTSVPLCMPDYCKTENAVESYRNYYNKEKRHLAKWTRRTVPHWWID